MSKSACRLLYSAFTRLNFSLAYRSAESSLKLYLIETVSVRNTWVSVLVEGAEEEGEDDNSQEKLLTVKNR